MNALEYTIEIEPSDADIFRLRLTSPAGYLVADFGTAKAIAEMFGPSNQARLKFLKSLRAPIAWLYELKVAKEARGRGIGTELLEAALDTLHEHGVRFAVLSPRPETPDDRERLDRFYLRLGFQEVKAFKGESLWFPLMVLDLAR